MKEQGTSQVIQENCNGECNFFSHYFEFIGLMGKMELFEGHVVLEFEKVNLVDIS